MKKKLEKGTVSQLGYCSRCFFTLFKVFSLFFLLSLISVSSVFANSILQNVKVTVQYKNEPINKIIDDIEQQTGYSILVRNNDINTNLKITVNQKDKDLNQVLSAVFQGMNVKFDIVGKTISVYKPNELTQNTVAQQKRVVKGVVLDPNGEAVIGANVLEKETVDNGTITDLDGKFSLKVSENATLIISYIGYNTQEIPIKNRSAFKVILANDVKLLDEVVVTGYITQKKGLLTGAVSTMSVKDNLKTIPTTSAGNILVGKLAGVNVGTPNGVPGAQPSISIRTGSSWYRESNKNPQPVTYVIDGVVRGGGDFNNLSPNEIEDITVLKDAASAAIYGSRSAGGVIIVTTKKGNQGKPTFNYSYGFSVDTRTDNQELTNGVQTGELYNRVNPGSPNAWTQEELDHMASINNGWGYDQLGEVWQNPTTQSHNLNVNGGNDRVRYFGAASYVKQQGFLSPMTYDKYNIRMNITADVTKDFEVFTGFALYNNQTGKVTSDTDGGADTYGKLRIWQPEQPVYTDGGQLVDYGWIGNVGARLTDAEGYHKENYLKPQIIFKGTYKAPFLKGLSASVMYSKSWTNDRLNRYQTNYDMMVTQKSGANGRIVSTRDEDIVNVRKSTWVGKDNVYRKSSWSDDTQLNFQLNYSNTFKDLHHVSAALVTEWYEGGGASVYGGRETFPFYMTDQFWAASDARADTWGGGDTDWMSGRMSYIGQFSYSYADKYLLNFSFREDGSMNFAPNQRWGFFPAGSAGWVISEENFFNKSSIQFLKLRGSAGLTGDDSVGGWQWQESYKSTNKPAFFGKNPSKSVGLVYGSVVNPNLSWEKSLSYDVGAEMRFFDHWNVTADYWSRKTFDILDNRQAILPTTFSLTMPAENYGKMKAQGFDFELGYRGESRDFSYFANLTMSYGWNEITYKDYAENAQAIDIPIGTSSSRVLGFEFDKILRTQSDLDAFNAAHPGYKHNGFSPELGMMVYKDLSGPNGVPDNVIDDWDRVVLRAKNFPVVYGLNLGGSWKGLSLDMMFSGKLGEDKSFRDLGGNVEWNRKWLEWYDNSWTPETPDAHLPKCVSANTGSTYRDTESVFWRQNANFMRLKYLTVSYDLPKNQFYNKVFENVRVFLTGSNLFVLSGFKYYDPELGGGNAFPIMRSFNFGIDVKF